MPKEGSSINFIADKAAEADYFKGPHQRVADAIVEALCDTDVKTIGLIGPWGSGKSTVVRLVEQRLAKDTGPKFHVFTFDAWLHQSDPTRRAFLERLIAFLAVRKFGNDAEWKMQLDALLNRIDDTKTTTTPILTPAGKLLLPPLILLPIAYLFLGRPWYEKFAAVGSHGWDYWPFLLALGVLGSLPTLALIIYLWWRPTWKFWKRGFWRWSTLTQHRAPYEKESILSLISNRNVTHQHTTSIKGPDPTAIEFQKAFRNVLKWVTVKKEKLVIVVDNLDRLDRDEAVEMWTTIRSFFLGAIGDEEAIARVDLPSVILPVDSSAMARAQNDGSGTSQPGRAFMDKSFDVLFHVAPPVLTNWQSFFRKAMREVFGVEIGKTWIKDAIRIYRPMAEGPQGLTPRDVGRAVNAIAALWLQAKGLNIPFASIAYHAIYKDSFRGGLAKGLSSPSADILDLDPNWQISMAALYYGIDLTSAAQVFHDAPLRDAVSNNSSDVFLSQSAIEGFDAALDRLLEDREFLDIDRQANLIHLLTNLEDKDTWLPDLWNRLARLFTTSNLIDGLDGEGPACVDLLLSHVSATKRVELVSSLVACVGRWSDTTFHPGSRAEPCAKIISSIALAKQTDNISALKLTLHAKPSAFLNLASYLVDDEIALDFVMASRKTDSLANELASQIGPAGQERLEEKARIVLRTQPPDWNVLINTCSAVLFASEPDRNAQSAATIILGALFKRFQEAEDAVRNSAENGYLQSLLGRALGEGDIELAARAFVLMLLVAHPIDQLEDRTWGDYIAGAPELPSLVERTFDEWREEKFYPLFLTQLDHDPSILAMIERAMSAAIERGEIGILSLDDLLANPERFLAQLNSDNRRAFLELLPAQKDFWVKLSEAGVATNALNILRELIESSTPAVRQDARKSLNATLKALPDGEWFAAIRDGGATMDAASELQNLSGRPIAIGSGLSDALTRLMPELIASEERPFATRWFKAASFLSADYRRTLLKNLRDSLITISTPPVLENLLSEGGDLLLEDGEFAAKADEVMRFVVKPLIRTGGLAWLLEHQDAVAAWQRLATPETRAVVKDRLDEVKTELEEQSAERTRADLLLDRLSKRR